MELPSLYHVADRAKHRKRDREAVRHAYEALVSTDFSATVLVQLANLPREALDCWLVARIGVQQVLEAQRLLKTIPHTLTDAQRVELSSGMMISRQLCRWKGLSIFYALRHLDS